MRELFGRGFWKFNSAFIGIGKDTSDPYSKPKPKAKVPYGHGMRTAENDPSIAAMARCHAKDWIVTSPEGEKLLVNNLARFCREKDFDYQSVKSRMKRGTDYLGWTFQRVEKVEDGAN